MPGFIVDNVEYYFHAIPASPRMEIYRKTDRHYIASFSPATPDANSQVPHGTWRHPSRGVTQALLDALYSQVLQAAQARLDRCRRPVEPTTYDRSEVHQSTYFPQKEPRNSN